MILVEGYVAPPLSLPRLHKLKLQERATAILKKGCQLEEKGCLFKSIIYLTAVKAVEEQSHQHYI